MTTKADQIRRLYARGLSPQEIAKRVGCHDAYVRVVARQRANGKSVADRAYLAKAYSIYPKDHFNRLAREEYRKQRILGATVDEAVTARNRSVAKALRRAAAKATREGARAPP